MNALEDTRELVTVRSGPGGPWPHTSTRHAFIAGFVSDLIREYPDVELSSIRITELDGIITITGRRGPLTPDECPSCHTTAGHPHTDYCQTARPCSCPHPTLLGHRNNCPVHGESWRRVRGIDPPLGRGGEGERPGKLED